MIFPQQGRKIISAHKTLKLRLQNSFLFTVWHLGVATVCITKFLPWDTTFNIEENASLIRAVTGKIVSDFRCNRPEYHPEHTAFVFENQADGMYIQAMGFMIISDRNHQLSFL